MSSGSPRKCSSQVISQDDITIDIEGSFNKECYSFWGETS